MISTISCSTGLTLHCCKWNYITMFQTKLLLSMLIMNDTSCHEFHDEPTYQQLGKSKNPFLNKKAFQQGAYRPLGNHTCFSFNGHHQMWFMGSPQMNKFDQVWTQNVLLPHECFTIEKTKIAIQIEPIDVFYQRS